MSKHDGVVYCDYILCHLVIAPADRSQVNFLKSNYHGQCYIALRRAHSEASNPRSSFVTALLLALLVAISFDAKAEDVRGCYASYNSQTGGFSYEPFLKVRDKSSVSEDGQPEIWGFRPWNLEPPDKDGLTHPVNILESRFVPIGAFKEVPAGRSRRSIRCPDGLW